MALQTTESPREASPDAGMSLRERAYVQIKQRIITLKFQPGEYINESAVSKQLNIGRTPVHQALNRLMLEGMVDVIPRKGVIVKPMSIDEVLKIVETRLAVEPYCVQLAAKRAEHTHLDRMTEILRRSGPLVSRRDIEGLMELDREFHGAIADAAQNEVLRDILRNLHQRSLRFWFVSLNDDIHLRNVQSEHQAILDALVARDAEDAANQMREHIRSFGNNVSRRI